MEKFHLEKDIKVLCVTAKSFPEGIQDAHEKLHSLIPFSDNRRYFGISRPNRIGIISYKAAAEELKKNEAEKYECETFVIEKGEYTSITVRNYTSDIQSIGKAFEELIANPDIDPMGYCIEWYLNQKDVRCMVKLRSTKS